MIKPLGFVVIAVILAICGIFTFTIWKNYQLAEDIKKGPSNQEVLDSIVQNKPVFLDKGSPIIKIVSVQRFQDNWYVAVIKSPNDRDMEVPVKIILEDIRSGKESRNLKVILGPASHFTEYAMLQSGIPSSLIQELRK